jgi:hypothetical protein
MVSLTNFMPDATIVDPAGPDVIGPGANFNILLGFLPKSTMGDPALGAAPGVIIGTDAPTTLINFLPEAPTGSPGLGIMPPGIPTPLVAIGTGE